MSSLASKKRTGGGFSALTAKRGASSSSSARRRSDDSSESGNDSDEGIRSGSSNRSQDRGGRRFDRDSSKDRERERDKDRDRDRFSRDSRDRDDWNDRNRRGRRTPTPPRSESESGSSENLRGSRTPRTTSSSRSNKEDYNSKPPRYLSSLDDKHGSLRTSPRWQQQNSNSRDSDSPPAITVQPPKARPRQQAVSLDRQSATNSARLRGIRESDEDSSTPPTLKKKGGYSSGIYDDDRPITAKNNNNTRDLRSSRSLTRIQTDSDSDGRNNGVSMVERLSRPTSSHQSVVRRTPPADDSFRGSSSSHQTGAHREGTPMLALPWKSTLKGSSDDINVPPPRSSTLMKTPNSATGAGKSYFDTPTTRRVNRLDGRMGDMPLTSDNVSRVSNASAASSLNGSLRSVRSMPSKEKSFLVGSPASSSGSMLGAAELERMFPQRRVRIYFLTWNMGSPKSDEAYPTSWDALLLPETVTDACDIFVVALQELPSNNREVLLRIQEVLGPCFLPLASEFCGTLGLCVFVNRDLIWYCSVPQKASLKTRQSIQTKGASGIAFHLFGTSFVFLSTHLKSDTGNIEQRIDDYNKILKDLDLPQPTGTSSDAAIKQIRKSRDLTQRFDYTFWIGDLNFRISASKETVESMARAIDAGERPHYEALLKIDELFLTQTESKAFEAFQEGRINFPPTYKYDLNSDTFDTSHLNRIPAYTDRVLYHCKQKVTCTCVHYNCIRSVKTSDHRAVYAVFECDLKPGRDNIPLCAGEFDRSIYLEGNRRRAIHLDYLALKKDKSSKVCVIS